jgi:hypothetical protein
MTEAPFGLSFTEVDEGFILRRKERDGTDVSIPLSTEEVIGLKSTVDLWADRILLHAQAKSGSVRALVAHPVGEVELDTDALQENLLLTLAAPTGQRTTFSVPPAIATYIADEIRPILATMRAERGQQ